MLTFLSSLCFPSEEKNSAHDSSFCSGLKF
jgi:hypothetical protein